MAETNLKKVTVIPSVELLLPVDLRRRNQKVEFSPFVQALMVATIEGQFADPFGNVWLPWAATLRSRMSEDAEPIRLLTEAILRGDGSLVSQLEKAFPLYTAEDDGMSFEQRLALPSLRIADNLWETESNSSFGTAIVTPAELGWRLNVSISQTKKGKVISTKIAFPGFATGPHAAYQSLVQGLQQSYAKHPGAMLKAPVEVADEWANIKSMENVSAWMQSTNGPYSWVYLKEVRRILSRVSPHFATFLDIMDEHLAQENDPPAKDSIDLFRRYIGYRRKEWYFEDLRCSIENAFDGARIEAQRQKINLGTGATLALGNPDHWYLPKSRVAALAVDGVEIIFTLEDVQGKPRFGIAFRSDPEHSKAEVRNLVLPELLRGASKYWKFGLNAEFMNN